MSGFPDLLETKKLSNSANEDRKAISSRSSANWVVPGELERHRENLKSSAAFLMEEIIDQLGGRGIDSGDFFEVRQGRAGDRLGRAERM